MTATRFLRNSYWNRAQALQQLQKYSEAVKDWDQAIELSPPEEHLKYRVNQATVRVKAGLVGEALADVSKLTKTSNWNAEQWYAFACVYAVASGKLADKRQVCADQAMEMLQKAVKAGYRDVAHIKKDADLNPLRTREDFKKLLTEVEKATEIK